MNWAWEAFDDDGTRLTYGFDCPSKETCLARLYNWWRDLTEGGNLDALCHCGGHVVGWTAFEAGHSHWCPVAADHLQYEEE